VDFEIQEVAVGARQQPEALRVVKLGDDLRPRLA